MLQEPGRFCLDRLQVIIVINPDNVAQVFSLSAIRRGTFTSALLTGSN
jgi:hypothetical protein